MPPDRRCRPAAAKDWCFTLNNPEVRMEEGLKRLLVTHCAFGSMGESKKTRMPHLQGFVQLKIKSRMETVKAKLSIGRAHLEKRRGTPQEARDYC